MTPDLILLAAAVSGSVLLSLLKVGYYGSRAGMAAALVDALLLFAISKLVFSMNV